MTGLDTEFYGTSGPFGEFDLTKESPVGRTTCHVFSVAAPTGPILPRGHHQATSWVFAGALLTEPCVKEWLEDAKFTKAVHNQPVDQHTIRNHGVRLAGGVNTLAMARFWYPERVKGRGFGLDNLGSDLVGAGKTESFEGLFGYEATEQYTVTQLKPVCACMSIGCRKRKPEKSGLEHIPVGEVEVETVRNRKVRRFIPLTEISPAHPLWPRYLAYAAWDAVLALAVYEIMVRDGKRERPYPWSLL